MTLKDSLKALNHHAYAIIGGNSFCEELLEILEKQHSIKIHGNPDLYVEKYSNFTIDDARAVKVDHLTRPMIEGGKKIFILQMNGITVEAQNGLLKLLEEPAEYAIFFIIIPSAHLLLPTVRSRVRLIDIGGKGNLDSKTKSDTEYLQILEVEKFIKGPIVKRLEMIKVLMGDIDNEKKSKQDAIDFINAIQSAVYRQKGAKIGKPLLESIELARRYMNDRSPSLKMLLEYVALNI